MRRLRFLAIFLIYGLTAISQEKKNVGGIIAGNLMDSATRKAISGASVQLTLLGTSTKFTKLTDANGEFSFIDLQFGYYGLSVSNIGYASLRIDSINVRAERFDFNLADIKLSTSSKELESVVIYAEKPLIESKDGNIKGVLLQAYGVYSEDMDPDLLKKLAIHH